MAVALGSEEDEAATQAAERSSTMTPEKVAAIAAAAKRLRENPLFAEYLASIEEYRRQHNTVPDAE